MAKGFSSQVSDGMDVFDARDEKIGTVHEVYDASAAEKSSSGGGYLRVPTGFLGLGKEHHIPFSAIRSVRDGRIHLGVEKDRLDELGFDAAPIETDEGGTIVEHTTTTTTSAPAPAMRRAESQQPASADEGRRKLQLREEELIARKRSVETGEVGIRTEVVSEQRTLEVPVTHEEITIERHAVDRRPTDRPISEGGQTFEVPLTGEEVTLEKRAVVYEEVNVGKRAVQETQQVSGTVRREEAVIESEGDVQIEGDTETSRPRRT